MSLALVKACRRVGSEYLRFVEEIRALIANLTAETDRVCATIEQLDHGQVQGDASRLPGWHQAWMLDETIDGWRLDVMVEPGDSNTWVYRRDGRITARRDEMIGRTSSGIPYLRPHGALLYKAARPRPKDEADFAIAAPHLRAAERRWLTEALAMAYPGHPWIRRLVNSYGGRGIRK